MLTEKYFLKCDIISVEGGKFYLDIISHNSPFLLKKIFYELC